MTGVTAGLAAKSLPLRLTVAMIVATLLLYLLYSYEPTSFLYDLKQALPVHEHDHDALAADLTVLLRPGDHTHRPETTLHLDWVITKGYRYPDGVGKWVYLVNGQFPGPNVEARPGDSVSIEVHNRLQDEALSLHFHGLHMEGSNDMDGVVGVTQKPVSAGGSFTYSFNVSLDQAGTFWWHSHSELQRADGLYGAFVVHEPDTGTNSAGGSKSLYDDEMVLLVGDWYHLSAADVQKTYDTHEFWGMEPVPDSLLINGHGAFNCSKATKSRPVDCKTVPRPQLTPCTGKSRLRVVNVGAMSGFTLKMPGRSMRLLTVDGGGVVDLATGTGSGVGVLYPGERVDVIVEWGAPSSDNSSLIEVILDRENYKKKNLALTPEQSFPILGANKMKRSPKAGDQPIDPSIINLAAVNGTELPPATMDEHPSQVVLVYTRVELLAHLGNAPKGFINRTYWEPQDVPLIETGRQSWDEHQLVPFIPTSEGWVDIVINNVDEAGHPFHLHGYDFFVVSSFRPSRRGWFAYNPYDTSKQPAGGAYNMRNPVRKDSIYVAGGGYAVLRIRPTNPGLWFLHCHILWHQGVGMAMTIRVGENDN